MSVMSAVRKDSAASIVEQVLVGATFFILYGFLIRVVGAEMLGVWSLVMVSVNLGQLANLGIASGLIRFVARSEGDGDRETTIAAIETAFLLTVGIFLTLGLLLYFPFRLYLDHTVPAAHRDLAQFLLPFGIVILILTNIANVPLSALGGMQMFRWRSLISVISTLVGLAVVVAGAGSMGIFAATVAFMVQPVIGLVLGWRALRKSLPELSLVPHRFRMSQVRELLGFGMQIQLITIATMFLEPATRLVLGLYGTLESVTFFTLAWRFVLQARSFVFSGLFVMTPAFGRLDRQTPEQSNPLYHKVNRLAALVGAGVFGGVAAMSPFVSDVWIGHREPVFVAMTIALVIGWQFNTLALGAYVRGLGEGVVSWILWGHVLMAVLNPALGYVLGRAFGTMAAIWALTIALGVASLTFGLGTHRRFGLAATSFVRPGDVLAMAIAACAAWAGYATYLWAEPLYGIWPAGLFALAVTSAGMLVMVGASDQRAVVFGLAAGLLRDLRSAG